MDTKNLTVVSALMAVLLSASSVMAEEAQENAAYIGDVIVTAPATKEPLTVETDPKSPRQPVPPADGAGYLKNIPGISVTRKGGTGGDPVFRGMAGSRLGIVLDGEYLLGGCGGRMDPPTTYAFPESYDRITLLKGPQTVVYGGGNVAGTVLFERETGRFEAPGVRGSVGATAGSFGRNDQMLDVTAGNTIGFVRVIGTRSDSNNYEDGDGREVHSFYTRESVTSILGLTPDARTRAEFTADFSWAEAAYADRTMDGAVFDRQGYSLKLERRDISGLLSAAELFAYYNYIDHVMDNFSLRTPTGMKMLSNPDRATQGVRLKADLTPGQNTVFTAGVDYEEDQRTSRSGVNYDSQPRVPDMTFEKLGVFAEAEHDLDKTGRLIGGLRLDFVDVTNDKPGSQAEDSDNLNSAFLRYEHDLGSVPVTAYIGVGLAERTPDWWERNKVFTLEPERNTQTDAGLIYNSGSLRASVALFYSKISDFMLITSTTPGARNIDATTYGGEAEVSYSPFRNWTATAAAAYTHGDNDTDNKPLAQVPPLEGTLGVKYDDRKLMAGVLLRAVARQDRVDVGNGSIVGTDIGETPGFSVFSANAGYRPVKGLLVTGGVDNIFDRTYAEHISKAVSSSVTAFGLQQTTRVNEPGRTLWLKANYAF